MSDLVHSGLTPCVPAIDDGQVAAHNRLMDHAHHALGRPEGAHVVPYRNYFATEVASDHAKAFDCSPFWKLSGVSESGGMAFYHVTDEGKAAVWKWLRASHAAKGLRSYTVRIWWDELEPPSERNLIAKSRSAAKYHAYLCVSDAWSDLTFRRFCGFRIQVLVR